MYGLIIQILKECDRPSQENHISFKAKTNADSRTEIEPGTRKSITTNPSLTGWNSNSKIKPTEFNDLFVSPDEPPKKRANITLEMSLLKIYTKMRSEILSSDKYYNFIKDVNSGLTPVSAQQMHAAASDGGGLRHDGRLRRLEVHVEGLHEDSRAEVADSRMPAGVD